MRFKLFVVAALLACAVPAGAQITIPNVFVTNTTISSTAVNTNFSTLATHALDRVSGGNITGNVTVDALVTIDGVDIGVQACVACTPTFASLTLTGGLTAGSGTVGIINSAGKIPAISSTYVADLSGVNLTGVALLAGTNAYSGANTYAGVTTLNGRTDLAKYSETYSQPAISSSALTLNLDNGSHFLVVLNSNATVTISNPTVSGRVSSFTLWLFPNSNSQRTFTWPASVKWAGGSAPTLTATSGKVDILTFLSYDGGTSWYGFVGGQNF